MYVSSGDLEEPLIPSHLLVSRSVLYLPDNLTPIGDVYDSEFIVTCTSTSSQTVKCRKHLRESLNYCWTRWCDQYLDINFITNGEIQGKSDWVTQLLLDKVAWPVPGWTARDTVTLTQSTQHCFTALYLSQWRSSCSWWECSQRILEGWLSGGTMCCQKWWSTRSISLSLTGP